MDQLAQGGGADPFGGGPAHRGPAAARPARAVAAGHGGHAGQRPGLPGGRLAPDRDPAGQPDRRPAGRGRGPGPAGPDGRRPAPQAGGPGRPGGPAGGPAVDLPQPAGSLRQLSLRLFPPLCAGPAPPQKGPAVGGPERHPDALGAADGPGPRPRARQPLQGGAARPLCPADRQPAGGPLGGAGGRVRPPLPARGHRPAALPALPAEKEHGGPFVLPAGRAGPERLFARGL